MTMRLIHTEQAHATALAEIEPLWDAEADSSETDRLELLVMLVEAYEADHYPIPAPDPIELILHVKEARSLTRRDMEHYLGSRGRVSEVLNLRRPLPLEMIRRLRERLRLPADVLVQPYHLAFAKAGQP